MLSVHVANQTLFTDRIFLAHAASLRQTSFFARWKFRGFLHSFFLKGAGLDAIRPATPATHCSPMRFAWSILVLIWRVGHPPNFSRDLISTHRCIAPLCSTATGFVEKDGIWYHYPPALLCGNDGCASLDIVNSSLDTCDANQVAQLKRLVHQQENTGKKVLKNVLECKAYRHAGDAQHLDEVGGSERWRHYGKCNQKSQDHDTGLHKAAD